MKKKKKKARPGAAAVRPITTAQTESVSGETRRGTAAAEAPHRSIRPLWFMLFFGIVLACAVQFRTFQIETRPLHSDEAVNFLFVENINNESYYPYSHENYHGPLFFYLITGLINLRDDSVGSLRAESILCGILMVFLPLAFRKSEGSTFSLTAAALTALSPSLVFFTRYAIHESLLVLATFLFAASLYHWSASRRPLLLYVAAFALAVLVTTKETFAVAVFCVALSLLSLGNFHAQFSAVRKSLSHIFYAYLMMISMILACFSAGFRWSGGLREMVLAIPQWIGRSSSDIGHVKPPLYYLKSVIWPTEPVIPVSFLAALALLVIAWGCESRLPPALSPRRGLLRFLFVWTISSLLIYSFIPYKTVWLVINITLPGVLFAAAILSALIDHGGFARKAGLAGVTAALVSQIFFAAKYNLVEWPVPGLQLAVKNAKPYGPENPFSYVHTSPPMLELIKEVHSYWLKNTAARILVGVDGYFPLPYYLRNIQKQVAYTKIDDINKASEQYDIMILDFYKQKWENPNWDRKYYRLSDYAESFTYFRKSPDLK